MAGDNLVPPFRFTLLASSPFPTTSTSTSTSSLYRGSLPLPHHLPFLKSLNLKTIISLTPKSLSIYEEERLNSNDSRRELIEPEEGISDWCELNGVKIIHVKADKSKDGSLPFNSITVKKVLELLITEENLPIYIHDLDGSDVLGIIGAALRKLMGWTESSYIDELSRFLRIPPAEPAHLTFVKKLFNPLPSSSSSSSNSNNPSVHANLPPTSSSTLSSLPLTTTNGEDSNTYILIPNKGRRAKWFYSNGISTITASSNTNTLTTTATGGGITSNIILLGGMRCKLEPEPIIESTKSSNLSSTSSNLIKDSNKSRSSSTVDEFRKSSTISVTSTSSGHPPTKEPLEYGEEGESPAGDREVDTRTWSGSQSFTEGGVLNGLMRKESESSTITIAVTSTSRSKSVGGKEGNTRSETGEEERRRGRRRESSAELVEQNEATSRDENEENEDEEEEDEDEEEEEEVIPLSQMIDALDLGL